jgi:Arc/MetJ-type ribon-helix-helix transcriptional regulator
VAVVIDSGRPEATDPLDQWPPERWGDLAYARRSYIDRRINSDCRYLVEFVADAERMYEPLGYASADDFIRQGLDLDPEDVALAVTWLKKNQPDQDIPLKVAVQLGKRGRPRKGEEKDYNVILKQQGNSADYLRARLDRDHPEIAEALDRKEYRSIRQAAIAAGIVKPPTPLNILQSTWAKASQEERDEFITPLLPEQSDSADCMTSLDVEDAMRLLCKRFSREDLRCLRVWIGEYLRAPSESV